MSDKPMKIPDPDHPIMVERIPSRIIWLNGQLLADTRNALTLREARYPAVQYIPRIDTAMSELIRSDHTTYRSFKATAPITTRPAAANALPTQCERTRHRSTP